MKGSDLFDCVIMGAGPAGSVLAKSLSTRGRRVLWVEKNQKGQARVCGGFVGPEAREIWQLADLPELTNANANPIHRVIVSGIGTDLFEIELSRNAWAVDRCKFDQNLQDNAEASGARLFYGTKLHRSCLRGGIWEIELDRGGAKEQVRSHHLIWAAGRRTVSRNASYVACKAVYAEAIGHPDAVALHFVEKGHVGLNPIGKGKMTLCLYVHPQYIRNAGGDLDAMMSEFRRRNEMLDVHLGNAKRISPWQTCVAEPDSLHRFYEGGVFFAGDAVAMIDPIVGGGIPIAMKGAWMLAQLLSDTGYAEDAVVARDYKRMWLSEFEGRRRMARFLGTCERSEIITRAIFWLGTMLPGFMRSFMRRSRPMIGAPAQT